MKSYVFAMLLMGAAVIEPFSLSPADASCAIPPAQARKLISNNGLISAGRARQAAISRVPGRAFFVKLCRSGNRFYYAVSVMQGKGGGKRLTTVKVDARSGQAR